MDNEFKILSRAIQLVELGRFDAALSLIEDNFGTLETLGPVHQMLAFCYMQIGEYEKAVHALKSAQEKNPEDATNHSLIGAAYSAIGKTDLATESFKASLELNPNLVESYNGLARIYLNQENSKLAKRHIESALNIEPNNEQSLLLKSVFEKLIGLDKESQASLLKGLEINPLNKELLFEKANRDMLSDGHKNAQEIYQQLILENPDNFLLEEKIIESSLSDNWLYRNLLFKYRLFPSISYLLVLFVLAMILFGGGFYSSLDDGSQAKQAWKYFLFSISIWSAIFWIGRLITHAWMAKTIWNKPLIYYFNPHYAASLYISIALVYFALYMLFSYSQYFAFAGFLALFAVLFLGFILIEKKLTKRIYTAWFVWLHIAALTTFLYSSKDSSEGFNKLLSSGDLFAFSLLIPFGISIIYIGVKGLYDDWKNRKQTKDKEKVEEETVVPKTHMVLYVSIFLLFLSIRIAYNFIGQNILNPLGFYSFWILFPLGVMFYLYLSGKMMKWYRHYLTRFKYDADYVSRFFLISGIFTVILSIVVGFLVVNFVVISRQEVQTKLLMNGRLQSKSETFLKVEYEGYTERIRPKNIRDFPSVDTGTVKLVTHKSILGVTVADSIFLVNPSTIEE